MTVLRNFADLAERSGFTSPQITDLKKYPTSTISSRESVQSKPLLVTTGPGEKKGLRCGLPTKRAYDKDGPFLVVEHLHSEAEEEWEGITSFFVRKSVYLAFFGRPATKSLMQTQTGQAEDTDEMQGVLQHGTQEQEQEQEALALQQEWERAAQLEREREALTLQQERERVAQLEREALALQQERERVTQLEREALALQQEQKRLEQEKYRQRLEEPQSLEQQRKREDQQRLQQDELFEAEKAEEIPEREIMNLSPENKALSTARAELPTAGGNVKRKTQIALERALGASRHGNRNRASNGRGKRRRGRSLEQPKEAQTQASPVLEPPLNLATESRTATSTERRSNDSSVRINFKIRKDQAWKSVLVLNVNRSDPLEVERAAKRFMRQKLRLFDTNLRMMTLPECFETVVADRTNTILLIPETEIDISDELVVSASSLRARALSRNKLSLRRITAHRNSHTLHAHARSRTGEATPKLAHKVHNRDVHK